jgi:hypothetical protein
MRLTIRQEEVLVIIRMSKLTEPVTKEYVRDVAENMLEQGDKRPLGIRWVDNFLFRHHSFLRMFCPSICAGNPIQISCRTSVVECLVYDSEFGVHHVYNSHTKAYESEDKRPTEHLMEAFPRSSVYFRQVDRT